MRALSPRKGGTGQRAQALWDKPWSLDIRCRGCDAWAMLGTPSEIASKGMLVKAACLILLIQGCDGGKGHEATRLREALSYDRLVSKATGACETESKARVAKGGAPTLHTCLEGLAAGQAQKSQDFAQKLQTPHYPGLRTELQALAKRRRAGLVGYAQAVKGGKAEGLLASLKEQAAVEKQALGVQAKLRALP